MRKKLHQHCIRWLENHWKRHEPEPHHLYRYEENESVAVPEFHTGKVKHHEEDAAAEETFPIKSKPTYKNAIAQQTSDGIF